ncbi:MAG: hypothetical protein LW636_02815 [Planctomycetaceae bacterium]|jgi:hypothetical protein|nr:hypothetical protein [Planctomycetaceae bacterium]
MTTNFPQPQYPTTKLLVAIAVTGLALLALWWGIRDAAQLTPEVYRGGVLGLLVATAGHLAGTLVGSALAPSKGAASAYLASTAARFILTPILAVLVSSFLPVKAQPLLVGAATGYLLILVADIGTMLKAMKQPGSSTR